MKVLAITNFDRASIHDIRPEAEMLIGLKRLGVDMELMTRADSPYGRRLQEVGIPVHDHIPRRKLAWSSIRRIRATLRAGQHDILHLFNKKAIVNGIFASWGLPVHVVLYRGQTGNVSRFDPAAYLSHLSPRVERIVCVSESVRQSLLPEVRDPDVPVTIYKGHDLAWYADVQPASRAGLGVPADAFVIVCVANNRPRKGVPVLLEAFSGLGDLADVHLVLVGRGMTSTEIRSAARRCPHPERVHLFDHRPDVLELVASCDVAVLPATRREGLPKTVIEAMALAVAPVVTRTGGAPELVEHERSGLVVEPGDADALATALRRLAADRPFAADLGTAARQRLGSRFRVEDSIQRHLELYRSLVAPDVGTG